MTMNYSAVMTADKATEAEAKWPAQARFCQVEPAHSCSVLNVHELFGQRHYSIYTPKVQGKVPIRSSNHELWHHRRRNANPEKLMKVAQKNWTRSTLETHCGQLGRWTVARHFYSANSNHQTGKGVTLTHVHRGMKTGSIQRKRKLCQHTCVKSNQHINLWYFLFTETKDVSLRKLFW